MTQGNASTAKIQYLQGSSRTIPLAEGKVGGEDTKRSDYRRARSWTGAADSGCTAGIIRWVTVLLDYSTQRISCVGPLEGDEQCQPEWSWVRGKEAATSRVTRRRGTAKSLTPTRLGEGRQNATVIQPSSSTSMCSFISTWTQPGQGSRGSGADWRPLSGWTLEIGVWSTGSLAEMADPAHFAQAQ